MLHVTLRLPHFCLRLGSNGLARQLPYHHARRDADVEGVLRAKLRYFEATVARIDHLLVDALHVVAKDITKASYKRYLKIRILLQNQGAKHQSYYQS